MEWVDREKWRRKIKLLANIGIQYINKISKNTCGGITLQPVKSPLLWRSIRVTSLHTVISGSILGSVDRF